MATPSYTTSRDMTHSLNVCRLYVLYENVHDLGVIAMARTTALEFQRKFGSFQHEARREPVEITRHGRREFVLMSAEHYDWLRAAAQRMHRTADAAAVVIDAVERSEMDAEQAELDALMT